MPAMLELGKGAQTEALDDALLNRGDALPAFVAWLFHADTPPAPPNVLAGAVTSSLYFPKRYTNSGGLPQI